jgi:mono/diheme cytochrome c family protein
MIKKISIAFFFLVWVVPIFAQNTKVQKPIIKKISQSGLSASIKRGKVVYATYCLSCHQADGGGVPNMNPPLIQTSYVLGDKYSLIKIVLNGFQKPVDIDGESYSNNMPALNSLKDQQIADVLTYIRNNFDNKGSAVVKTEVQKVRNSLRR